MRGRWIEQRREPDLAQPGPRRMRVPLRWRAFLPDPIDALALELDGATAADVADAQEALAELRHVASSIAGFEVLARRLLRMEAVASSRIEAIDVPHRRLAEAEAGATGDRYETARTVVGNVAAMARAIELGAKDDALRLENLESMHGLLMAGSPFLDDQQRAGMLRTDVSFIGGTSPATADFVPPPPDAVPELMDDLLRFANTRHDLSPVVVAAIAHAQFETIHPFHDGNGRVGRCLIHTLLRRHGTVTVVTPPVSLAIAQDGSAYVDGLIAFREGGLDQWISQFALIISAACHAALRFATDTQALQADWLGRINAARAGRPLRADATAHRLLGLLPDMPVITAASVVDRLGVSWKAALDGIAELEAAGILVQTSIGRRNRVHEARDLFELLDTFERQPW